MKCARLCLEVIRDPMLHVKLLILEPYDTRTTNEGAHHP